MTRDPAWLAAFEAGAFFFALGLACVLVLLPWWLARVEGARRRPMRRMLALAALQAHRDCGENVVALSREFFRENAGAPLERLIRARRAIERQAADAARFGRVVAVYAPAVDARHAALLADTAALVGLAEDTLSGLTRLYLGQAIVRVGANVVHGDDALGYAPAQIGADVAMLGADVRRFCAKLQPSDADCVGYKTRPQGERVARTLDGLIARFDRR